MPATSQPAAIASRAASWPTSPRPITTTLAPGPDLGHPQPVQRDGRHGGERGVRGGHPVRHDGAQQAGHGLELGVVGLARAAGGDQLAGPDAGDRGADLQTSPAAE